MERQVKEAFDTLRIGIDTILQSDVPYDELVAALNLVEEKLNSAEQTKGEKSQPLSDADECMQVLFMGL